MEYNLSKPSFFGGSALPRIIVIRRKWKTTCSSYIPFDKCLVDILFTENIHSVWIEVVQLALYWEQTDDDLQHLLLFTVVWEKGELANVAVPA